MITEDINRLQRQLIVHSFLYYRHGQELWTDQQWDEAAYKLVSVKDTKEFKKSRFFDVFEDFDGSTGYHFLSDNNLNPIYWDNLAQDMLYYAESIHVK